MSLTDRMPTICFEFFARFNPLLTLPSTVADESGKEYLASNRTQTEMDEYKNDQVLNNGVEGKDALALPPCNTIDSSPLRKDVENTSKTTLRDTAGPFRWCSRWAITLKRCCTGPTKTTTSKTGPTRTASAPLSACVREQGQRWHRCQHRCRQDE